MSSNYSGPAIRRSLLHFLFGKALNASVSMVTLVLLSRWLAPQDYGVYIALIALQTSLLAISGFGIEATTERYIPEFRMRHSDRDLSGFVFGAITGRLLSLVALSLVLWAFSHPITSLIGIDRYHKSFEMWIVVITLFGIFTFLVIVLEAMLRQKQAQLCYTSYTLLKLLLLFVDGQRQTLGINELIRIEMIAAAAGILTGLFFLGNSFKLSAIALGWQITYLNRERLKRFAFFNYVAQLVFQLFNAEFMKLLVTRALGLLESARYGFAYNLADTLQRYLPAVLLLRLIKPIFITRYTQSGDIAQLCAMAKLVLKLNLLVLTPAIAFALVYGDVLLSALSDGNFPHTGALLAGIIATQIFGSHQLALSLVASTLEKNAMQLYAGVFASVAFPAAIFLTPFFGVFGAVASTALGAVVYNAAAVLYLNRAGVPYLPDAKSGLVFLIAGAVLFAQTYVITLVASGATGLVLAVISGAVSFLACVRLLGAFSPEERRTLNGVLPRPIFIF